MVFLNLRHVNTTLRVGTIFIQTFSSFILNTSRLRKIQGTTDTVVSTNEEYFQSENYNLGCDVIDKAYVLRKGIYSESKIGIRYIGNYVS